MGSRRAAQAVRTSAASRLATAQGPRRTHVRGTPPRLRAQARQRATAAARSSGRSSARYPIVSPVCASSTTMHFARMRGSSSESPLITPLQSRGDRRSGAARSTPRSARACPRRSRRARGRWRCAGSFMKPSSQAAVPAHVGVGIGERVHEDRRGRLAEGHDAATQLDAPRARRLRGHRHQLPDGSCISGVPAYQGRLPGARVDGGRSAACASARCTLAGGQRAAGRAASTSAAPTRRSSPTCLVMMGLPPPWIGRSAPHPPRPRPDRRGSRTRASRSSHGANGSPIGRRRGRRRAPPRAVSPHPRRAPAPAAPPRRRRRRGAPGAGAPGGAAGRACGAPGRAGRAGGRTRPGSGSTGHPAPEQPSARPPGAGRRIGPSETSSRPAPAAPGTRSTSVVAVHVGARPRSAAARERADERREGAAGDPGIGLPLGPPRERERLARADPAPCGEGSRIRPARAPQGLGGAARTGGDLERLDHRRDQGGQPAGPGGPQRTSTGAGSRSSAPRRRASSCRIRSGIAAASSRRTTAAASVARWVRRRAAASGMPDTSASSSTSARPKAARTSARAASSGG